MLAHPSRTLQVASILAAIRVRFGLVLIVFGLTSTEVALLALIDLPTLALYYLLNRTLGWPNEIRDERDVAFFLLGVFTWFLLGLAVGWLFFRGGSRRGSAPE
jgi:hypothetical protein